MEAAQAIERLSAEKEQWKHEAMEGGNAQYLREELAKLRSEIDGLKGVERMRDEELAVVKEKHGNALIELAELKTEASKDYAGMREFQNKFIAADHELRYIKEKLEETSKLRFVRKSYFEARDKNFVDWQPLVLKEILILQQLVETESGLQWVDVPIIDEKDVDKK